jgi:hypothetical protein
VPVGTALAFARIPPVADGSFSGAPGNGQLLKAAKKPADVLLKISKAPSFRRQAEKSFWNRSPAATTFQFLQVTGSPSNKTGLALKT